jgi:hypothetical protein
VYCLPILNSGHLLDSLGIPQVSLFHPGSSLTKVSRHNCRVILLRFSLLGTIVLHCLTSTEDFSFIYFISSLHYFDFEDKVVPAIPSRSEAEVQIITAFDSGSLSLVNDGGNRENEDVWDGREEAIFGVRWGGKI